MRNKYLINLIMTLLFLGGIGSLYGQSTLPPTPANIPKNVQNTLPPTPANILKTGNNPFYLDPSAALEVESTNKGFLPPRMDKTLRDAIKKPAVGLIVWCNDCNDPTTPKKGRLSVYTGGEWVTYLPSSAGTDNLTTGTPVRPDPVQVQVSGNLGNTFGIAPTETGVVYREIKNNDFATLPVLDDRGLPTTPTYKVHTDPAVTAAYSPITVAMFGLTSSADPFYFRTYAISPSGIRYGNTVIFNLAPPKISISPVTFTSEDYSSPVFTGTLTVNAGTPKNTITEYGYCSSTTDADPTTADNKVALSKTATGAVALDLLNHKLNSKTFTANPTVSLVVNNYNSTSNNYNYFRYYAVANGETIYSDVISFIPIRGDRKVTTGGSAKATLSNFYISKQLKIGENSTSKIIVSFKVTEAGDYRFTLVSSVGISGNTATSGLNLTSPVTGTFAASDVGKTVEVKFPVTGIPGTSLNGIGFDVSGIQSTLITGAIKKGDMVGGLATCDALHETEVKDIPGSNGTIWMDRNLGASRTAVSMDDYQAFGCLYQWGRGNDDAGSVEWSNGTVGMFVNGTISKQATTITPGNQFITVDTSWLSITNTNLWQGLSGDNNPCPKGYRVPTITELQESLPHVTDATTAYSSPLKLVFSKSVFGRSGGAFSSYSSYWSSSMSNNITSEAKYMEYSFNSSSSYDWSYDVSSTGGSVRCIKD